MSTWKRSLNRYNIKSARVTGLASDPAAISQLTGNWPESPSYQNNGIPLVSWGGSSPCCAYCGAFTPAITCFLITQQAAVEKEKVLQQVTVLASQQANREVDQLKDKLSKQADILKKVEEMHKAQLAELQQQLQVSSGHLNSTRFTNSYITRS